MAGVRSMLDHCSSKTINPGLYFHQCPGSEPGTTGRDNAATVSCLHLYPTPQTLPFSLFLISHFSPSIFTPFPVHFFVRKPLYIGHFKTTSSFSFRNLTQENLLIFLPTGLTRLSKNLKNQPGFFTIISTSSPVYTAF